MANVPARKQAKLDAELARLETLSPVELRTAWQAQEGSAPPSVAAPLLRRLLGQRLQERQLGGLPALVVRELERVIKQGAGAALAVPQPVTRTLTPGARVIREWQGRTIAVLVTEDGFLFEERTYRSLSQIAREVTGAHWSGPRFFGITRRG